MYFAFSSSLKLHNFIKRRTGKAKSLLRFIKNTCKKYEKRKDNIDLTDSSSCSLIYIIGQLQSSEGIAKNGGLMKKIMEISWMKYGILFFIFCENSGAIFH